MSRETTDHHIEEIEALNRELHHEIPRFPAFVRATSITDRIAAVLADLHTRIKDLEDRR